MSGAANNFSIAPNSFARAIVHNDGMEFVVEFKFDVAVVREKEGSVPPQFDLEYRMSAIVQPARAGSEPTQLPAAFAPQRSLLVAGHDGHGYETALDGSVTNVQLHAPNDLLTGMPTATASFTWSGSSARPSDEVPDSVFACVYCGHGHPRSFRSDEHIVPRAFLSPSYVLKGTCHTLNHYFSHAFEKRCLQLPVIQELLLLFDPPKMPVFRGRVPTTDNRDVARWLHDGKNEIGELPRYTETDKCTVSITTAGGDVFRVTIRLPFPIVGSVQGLDRLLEEPDRRVERDRQRVTEYLRDLETAPTRNADLARALDEHGGRFVAPREVRMQRSERAEAEAPQLASTTIPLQGDDELLTKLLYKIAWTHAAKQLGPEVVRSSRFGRGMIEFLRSEHIIDRSAAAMEPRVQTRCPGFPGGALELLRDARACNDVGLLRPGIVLMGLAYEVAIEAVHAAMQSRGELGAGDFATAKRIERIRDKVKTETLDAALKKNSGLGNGKDARLSVLRAYDVADQLRARRNDAAHTTPRYAFDSWSENEEFLVSAGRHLVMLWVPALAP